MRVLRAKETNVFKRCKQNMHKNTFKQYEIKSPGEITK